MLSFIKKSVGYIVSWTLYFIGDLMWNVGWYLDKYDSTTSNLLCPYLFSGHERLMSTSTDIQKWSK